MREIVCDDHEVSYATFVCGHLVKDARALGFVQGAEDEEEEQARPDAWCDECEAFRMEHDGWTDDVEPPAGIRVVCHRCYDEIQAANELR